MADKIPDGIETIHILQAIKRIDSGFLNHFSESTEYDLVHNGKRYAPKAVIGVAAGILTGNELRPHEFKGGKNSKCFKILSLNGFKIEIKLESLNYPDEITEQEYREGCLVEVKVNRYERNPNARKKCIEYFGSICQVCEFNFENTYGTIGKNYIHVHHLVALSTIGEEYVLNPLEDLRPVCANCHAMLHKRNPPFTIDELKNKIV